MIEFAVSEKKSRALKEKMDKYNIRETDIIEKFIRSGGPGGQKINKSSTCVYLKHKPTGIEIKCQTERSQSVNRFLARRELAERIEETVVKEKSDKKKKIEKIRRQKRRRSKKAKEKVLKSKKITATKKKDRSYVKREIDIRDA